jgi:hypothetical protein
MQAAGRRRAADKKEGRQAKALGVCRSVSHTPGVGYGTFSRAGELAFERLPWCGKISILISSR